MSTVACPSCQTVNSTDAAACTQCGEGLAAAKLQQAVDEIRRVTEGFKAHARPRQSFYTFNGFGTTLLDYRALSDGTYEATRWVVALFLPLVPLATYIIQPQALERSYGQETSKFVILDKGQLTASRVLRTYLLAVAGLLPLALGFLNSTWVNRTLGGSLAFFAMLACFAWAIYIVFFKLKNEGQAYSAAKPAA